MSLCYSEARLLFESAAVRTAIDTMRYAGRGVPDCDDVFIKVIMAAINERERELSEKAAKRKAFDTLPDDYEAPH